MEQQTKIANLPVNNYDFPVKLCRLNAATGELLGREVPGRKAVVRMDTKEILAVVSNQYQITTHRDIIASFDQLNTLERDKYTLSKDGGVLFVYYKIRGINKKEVKKGDFVNFFVRVFNSYNTMTGRGFELYGNRLVCDNGMVVPRTLAGFSLRHQGKQKQVIQNAVQTYASRIKDIIELWSRWTEQDIHFGKVREFIKSLKLTEKPENYLIDKVLARKQPYKLWDIYNDLCYYTTHRMVNRGRNASFNQRKKETEYARKFYSFEWNS